MTRLLPSCGTLLISCALLWPLAVSAQGTEEAPDASTGSGNPPTEQDVELREPAPEPTPVSVEVPAAPIVTEPVTQGSPEAEPVVMAPTRPESAPATPLRYGDLDAEDVTEPEGSGPTIELEPGHGLAISAPDGRFGLRIRARGMLLATMESAGDSLMPGAMPTWQIADHDPTFDLQVRRARVSFDGHVFDPNVRFRLQIALSPSDIWEDDDGVPHRSALLDWYVELRHLRELNLRIGQFVLPFNRSRITSSSSMQLVDRSLANAEMHLDRDLAIMLSSSDIGGLGLFRYYASLSMNEGRDSTFEGDRGFIWLARAEFYPLGLFDNFSEGDLERTSVPRLVIGAAYAFADDAPYSHVTTGRLPVDGGTFDYHQATADVAFHYMGLSVYSELLWRHGWHHGAEPLPGMEASAPANALGWFLDAGYMLPGVDLEVAARYGFVQPGPLDVPAGAPNQLSPVRERSELGLGVNYYPVGSHAFKLQLDVFRLWDDAPGSDANCTAGACPQDAFAHGETRVRVMLQLSI